jgi:hypothetical protein
VWTVLGVAVFAPGVAPASAIPIAVGVVVLIAGALQFTARAIGAVAVGTGLFLIARSIGLG